MMKLLPSRHIWRCPFSASAPASGSTMVAPGRLCFHVKQQFLWLSQHSLPGSEVTAASGILGKFGIGSSLSQWVSGGARTGEWQQGRLLASNNVLPLGKGGLVCSGTEGDGDSHSDNGGVKETFSETFRGRGRGGRGGSERGRGGTGRGSFRPSFDRSEESQKRFYSSNGGQSEGFMETRGRGRGRGRFGNGGQRERFSSPGRGSEDRGSFRGRDNGGQRERFAGDMASFRGRGRGRGRGNFGNGSQREPFRSPGGEGDRESSRGRENFGYGSQREPFRSPGGEGDGKSSRGRENFGYGSQREPFRSPGGEGDRKSSRGRGSFGNGGERDRESFRGRGRGSFGVMRGGRGSFRDTQGASRSPSPYYGDSNSETDTSKRWDPAQSPQGGRGSFRGSRGGRAARGGRGSSSARGGRSSSNFGGRRLGGSFEFDRVHENAPSSPRRGQLFEGEEKWQRKVREKKAKQSYAREDSEDDDDPEEGGQRYPQPDAEDPEEESVVEEGLQEGGVEIWRRKKIAWLCKEIPVLRPTGIVTMLNSQRRWIQAVDTKEVMETLMRRNEILRAHRVLKWTMQQPWYENDFDLNTKMANNLGSNRKLTRMRELFDTIIATGQVPDISTYVILVKAYIADEASESVDEAYTIYNQMEQLGGYQQPAAVAFSLFQTFTDRKGGAHLRHLHQADALFESIKKKGTSWCMGLTPDQWRAMYTALIHMHSVQGNGERVRSLVADMREASLSLHPDCYAALIRVCAKDRNTAEAESVFKELIAAGHKPDWRAYVALIQTYGVAGLSGKVQSTFDEMEAEGVHVNLNTFEAVVEALIKAGDIEGARAALEKAEEKFANVLHASYNLLMEWYKSKDMLLEIEDIFNRMKGKNCRPNLQSYNNLIDSYILQGHLDQAEGIYEELKTLQGFHPNVKTCNLMIEAFLRAGVPEKVKEVYEYLTARKLKLPDEVMANVAEIVGEKKVQEKAKPKKLIPEQREMLVGVLLGGATTASHDHNRTYEITFELGDRPQEAGSVLINHLYDMFADWAQQAPRTDVDDDLIKIHRFSTVSHGSLRFYAHQYRPEGQPVIPRLIHRWLNPLSLAYWYMYGGEKCAKTGGMILNACQYTSKELTLVVKALKARTVDCVIKKRKSGRVLIFKDESATWVWRLMEPHILDELKDLLRPDMAVNTRGNDAPQAFDELSELKVAEEADLDVDSSDMGTGVEVSVKVGSFET